MSDRFSLYEFRLARLEDIGRIMAFYEAEWSANHILVKNRDFFCYQHVFGDAVNFMLAINKETNQIEGAEGFIQYSKEICDIGAVMWKVSQQCKTPLLGVQIVKKLKEVTDCRVYLGPGANIKTAVPLHRAALKHFVGKFDHYYMLSKRSSYKIAVIKQFRSVSGQQFPHQYDMHLLDGLSELDEKFDYEAWYDRKPYKDRWYISRRYFNHPVYKYQVYAASKDNGPIESLIVARELSCNGEAILRIVDILGDTSVIGHLRQQIAQLIEDNGYEYVDIYLKGISREILTLGGFVCRDDEDPNIIPNYFEPFEQKNIDIWYSLSDDEAVLFKADGDQDRPSFIPAYTS